METLLAQCQHSFATPKPKVPGGPLRNRGVTYDYKIAEQWILNADDDSLYWVRYMDWCRHFKTIPRINEGVKEAFKPDREIGLLCSKSSEDVEMSG